jgi:hypothetical protein
MKYYLEDLTIGNDLISSATASAHEAEGRASIFQEKRRRSVPESDVITSGGEGCRGLVLAHGPIVGGIMTGYKSHDV